MSRVLFEGAGNRFAVLTEAELRAAGVGTGAQWAARWCVERGLDGLLEVRQPESAALADLQMVIWNADGSRPEACGNGLRCVALYARETGLVSEDRVRVATDSGLRVVELLRTEGRIDRARASLGPARVLELELELSVPGLGATGSKARAIHVNVGNPHCVLFVDERGLERLDTLGPALVAHPHFPAGTNVELAWVPVDKQPIRARVWERGVGETAACGTGAAAIAVAAEATGQRQLPLEVSLPGGLLAIDRAGSPRGSSTDGDVRLTGPVSRVPVGGPNPVESRA